MRTLTAVCGYCGVTFGYRSSHSPGEGNPPGYCSRAHKQAAWRQRQGWAKRACVECGREFAIAPGMRRTRMLCSKTCQRRHHNARLAQARDRRKAAMLSGAMPAVACAYCGQPVVTPGARYCSPCNHRYRGHRARVAGPLDVLALDAVCQVCHGPVEPQTEQGVLVDWCPACQRAAPVPIRGRRVHDQRERLDAALADRVASEQQPARPGNYRHAGTTPLLVGKYAA